MLTDRQMYSTTVRGLLCFDRSAKLILGFRLAKERRRYFVTASVIGWAQA